MCVCLIYQTLKSVPARDPCYSESKDFFVCVEMEGVIMVYHEKKKIY